MGNQPVPPLSLDYGTAIQHFEEVGKEFFGYCISLGGLGRDSSVLDVGCGFGRLAVPLTSYLSPRGSYDGFDIVPTGIEWCREHIAPGRPNFRFKLVDVRNFAYRPEDGVSARSFRFPYPDDHFDLVFLRSVFTHMPPEEVDHYLGEIARVMRPGGRCLISYFLLNKESVRLMAGPNAARRFHHRDRMTMRDEPDGGDTVAFDEGSILGLYAAHGLRPIGPVHYGSWCGREEYLSSQDIIVATKLEGG
jgi:SAM-dependent methyltransferase